MSPSWGILYPTTAMWTSVIVGDETSGSDSVQCLTDLSTCCSGNEGPHRGDWYFPDGIRLPFTGELR